MPFKNAAKATNATNANIKPTPLVETYDMVVVAKHNLEVSNTTRHYKINIFSLNKTTITIAQNQTRTILNAVINQTNTAVLMPLLLTKQPFPLKQQILLLPSAQKPSVHRQWYEIAIL
jgi:hypothetical protein